MKNQQGFTLVEVLISIVLLAIGLISVAAMQTTAIWGNQFSAQGTVAIQMGEYMVDLIRVKSGTNPSAYNGFDTTAASCSSGDCLLWKNALRNSGLTNARGRVTVVQDEPMDNTAQIEVLVEWGVSGATRRVKFDTVKETWGT